MSSIKERVKAGITGANTGAACLTASGEGYEEVTRYGQVTALMLQALEEVGPMTLSELCDHIGRDRDQVGSVVSRLQRASVKTPRRIHITGYTNDTEGKRTYPRAIYALGDLPNAPRKSGRAQRQAIRRRISNRVNSVWMLGMAQRERAKVLAVRKRQQPENFF